jgi:folate-dependent phosphoribosylglycinamide formyltransferase PurN
MLTTSATSSATEGHAGRATSPLRVAILCSSRAPGLRDLLERDPARGRAYEIVCVLTSEPTFEEYAIATRQRVAVASHSIAAFYGGRPRSIGHDLEMRRAYDRSTVDRLRGHAPDLVLFDGYLYIATDILLDAFPRRILNLHFGDLTVRHADGRPVFAGKRSVRDAIVAGEKETASTLHLVNDVPDGGAPIVLSWPHAVSPLATYARQSHADDMLKAYIHAHQEWMIRGSAGRVLMAGLHLIAGRAVDLDRLSEQNPAKVLPWVVDDRGRLSPPEGMHVFERLWAYEHAQEQGLGIRGVRARVSA